MEERVAVITGGAGGIGRAAAERFVAAGARVLLVDLSVEGLEEAAATMESDRVEVCAADVSQPQGNDAMIRTAQKAFGGVDILLANAGIEGAVKSIVDSDVSVFDRVLAVNVRGSWLGLKAAIPAIASRGGGSILITSSVAGVSGAAGLSPYVTSKHAVIGMMRSAALECAPLNIRVNTVNPSPVETRMMRSLEEGFAPGAAEEARKSFRESIPLGRYAEPRDVAGLMLFLCSDEASFITGSVYMVDGGSISSSR